MTKKVVHIITSLGVGGAESLLYSLLSLKDDNDHIVISLTDKGAYGPKIESLGIKVLTLNMNKGSIPIKDFFRLHNMLKEIAPSVVQTWMYHANIFGGIAARLAGVKNIIWGIHGADVSSSRISLLTKIVIAAGAPFSWIIPNRIIACAQSAINVHTKIGYNKRKFVFIPNGYNTSKFKPASEWIKTHYKESLEFNENNFIVGMVGRWDPQKDHANALKALKYCVLQNLKLKLVLVGKDCCKDNPELMKIISELNIEPYIITLGIRDDVPELMGAFDIHVLSSASEAFPNVVCEAMACGVPCVATNVGDTAYIIGDTGWIVPAQQPDPLSKAIALAYKKKNEKPEEWTNLQDNARQRILDNFSIELMSERYRNAWEN